MDLKQKGIRWVSNFCHQIEEVCHEVDDIVGKHAIKYGGNQIQNVRDSGRRMYCDVVEDVVPALENCAEEELGREESYLKSLLNSNVSDDDCSTENLDASIEQKALFECGALNVEVEQDSSANVENGIKLNLSFVGEREEWEGDTESEAFDGVNYDAWGILTDISLETWDVNEYSQCVSDPSAASVVNENSESSQIEVRVNDELGAGDECVCDHAESSTSVSSMAETEPLRLKSVLVSAKSSGSYVNPFEIESCEKNMAGFGRSNSESCMASQAGLASCGLEPNEMMPLNSSSENWLRHMIPSQNRTLISLSSLDGSLVSSLESSMEDIQLNDEAEHEESCAVVDDNQLFSLSSRLHRGSYKKRIREFFGGKKRVVKEYEQLGIWYGDVDIDNSEGASPTLKPLRLDSENLQASETEWEML